MALAATAHDFPSLGLRRRDFWPMSCFLPAVLCSTVIFPAVLVLHGEMKPILIRSGLSNALTIDHRSWGRVGTVQDVEIRVERSRGRPVKLFVDSAFAKNFAIERSQPLPKTVAAEEGGQVLTFDAPPDSNLIVNLTLRPLIWGRSEVQLRSDVPGIMMAVSTLSELIVP